MRARFEQVGCVSAAQGFEFDDAAVIWGEDLRYDPATNGWLDDPTATHDSHAPRLKQDLCRT